MSKLLLNPFKRTAYILRTTQTVAAAGDGMLKGADRYNEATRGRCIVAAMRGEQFSVRVEPFTIGQRGTGKWMSHFEIGATGQFLPTHDGSVQLTLGFQRGTSAMQLGWRAVFYLLEVGVVANALWGQVVFPLGMSLGIILAVIGIPWSLVSYAQGMRQAGKDWADLLEMVRSSLHSHTVERA